ncbi:hypothetical protein HBI24_210370 [Parastagonospora nodorum]|nr:hypothetical protein HBH51_231560 [Parastagonospora nodorum]KAH4045073.1 hypothetical protein HBH49_204430 [Parastagonospora nodorum]KAH4062846.1 hypothetical protein HBH50_203070 [Parastagonospora nodorum]KAH4081605.1 hypothetical protein HBH48_198710 [Parastagonospora nodorum]KAH4112171.1 hypothetical protein HBH47_230050 [Parastagonospora nodorum]
MAYLDRDLDAEPRYLPVQGEDERQWPDVVETQGRYLETGPPTPVYGLTTDPWHVVDLYHALVLLHNRQEPRRELYGGDADESPLGHTPPETRARYDSAEDNLRREGIKGMRIGIPDMMEVSAAHQVVQCCPESNLEPNCNSQWAVLNPELAAEILKSPFYVADDGWSLVLGSRPTHSPSRSSTSPPTDTGAFGEHSCSGKIHDEGYHSRPDSLDAANSLKTKQHEQVVGIQDMLVA